MTNEKPPVVANTTKTKSMGLIFDWQDWLPYVAEADLPDDQKREMIETLWQIVVAFVDLGFDLNPHQQAQTDHGQESCGQTLDLKMLLEAAVLKSAALDEAAEHKPKQKEPTP